MKWIAAAMVALAAVSARAEAVSLKAAEIDALLSGNTTVGEWFGEVYRQYFDPDGSTIYAVKGRRSSRGKWRVDPETDLYESWWERTGWDAYDVIRQDGALYWVEEGRAPQRFTVEPGQNLLWPKD